MALTDLTRISTAGIATGTSLSGAILHGDAHFRGTNAGINSAIFDSSENELNLKDNVKLTFGNLGASDSEISFNGDSFLIQETSATGSMAIRGQQLRLQNPSQGNENYIECLGNNTDRRVKIYQGATTRFETTSTGAKITGILTATSFSGPTLNTSGISTFYDLRVSNNLTVEGTTTTLDTNVTGVDRLEVNANSNTDTAIVGIQSGSADIVNLFSGTTEVLTILDTGEVGLGTISPGASLHIAATLPQIRLTDTDSGNVDHFISGSGSALVLKADEGQDDGATATTIRFHIDTDEKMRITSAGYVGIGTVNPDANLEIYKGSVGTYLKMGGDDAQNGRALTFTSSTDNTGSNGALHTISATSGNGAIALDIAGTEKVRITSAGNVGIGTDISTSLLTLAKSANPTLEFKDYTNNAQAYITGSAGGQLVFQTDINNINANSDFIFRADSVSNEIVRFKDTGEVGIGSAAPTSVLDIVAADPVLTLRDTSTTVTNANATLRLAESQAPGLIENYWDVVADNTVSNFGFSIKQHLGGTTSTRFAIHPGTGYIGIGTNISTAPLHVRSDANSMMILESTDRHSTMYLIDSVGSSFIQNDSGEIRFGVGGTGGNAGGEEEKVRIDTDGRIGIGTFNPAQELDIWNDSPAIKLTDTNPYEAGGYGQIAQSGSVLQLMADSGNTSSHGSIFFYCYNDNEYLNAYRIADNYFQWFTQSSSNSEKMRLNDAGNLGIGTVAPIGKLDVRNASGTNPLVSLHHSNADVEGEVIRIGRVDIPTIRYHSIKAKHSGSASSNYISFNLHDTSSTTSQSEVLKVKGDGNVAILDGNLSVANGHGIDFSATSGSGTSELLDDYEMGTYVPTWTTIESNPTNYRNGIDSGTTSNGLSYVRIGKQVTVTGAAFWVGSSINNTRPNMSLPFPARIYTVSGTVGHYSLGETEDIHYLNYSVSTSINFYVQSANSGHEAFGDNTTGEMYFNITYMTTD